MSSAKAVAVSILAGGLCGLIAARVRPAAVAGNQPGTYQVIRVDAPPGARSIYEWESAQLLRLNTATGQIERATWNREDGKKAAYVWEKWEIN